VVFQDFVERLAGGNVRLEGDEFLAGDAFEFDGFNFAN